MLNCASRRHIYTFAVLHSFKNMYMPASTWHALSSQVIQTPFNSNLLFILHPQRTRLRFISTCADILARYTPSSIRMSWGLPPAESSGSTSAWPNQVTYSYNYGPSGALERVMYVIFLIILNGTTLSITVRTRRKHDFHE